MRFVSGFRQSARAGAVGMACAAMFLGGCASTPEEEVSLLFVQSAAGFECDGSHLVLNGVHPSTVYFSDRPERIVGQIGTDKFVDSWDDSPDSFADDPPNASLAVLEGDQVHVAVVELSNPKLAAGRLTYDVIVTEGSPPASGWACSLFIDSYHRVVDDRTHDQVRDIHRDTTRDDRVDDRTRDQVKDVTNDRTNDRQPDDRVNDRTDDRIHDTVKG